MKIVVEANLWRSNIRSMGKMLFSPNAGGHSFTGRALPFLSWLFYCFICVSLSEFPDDASKHFVAGTDFQNIQAIGKGT